MDEPIEKDDATEHTDTNASRETSSSVKCHLDTQLKQMAIRLSDVSFHVKAGETAAFVGATGAGKTTIMQLLARFYEVDKGEIYIDGIPISELPRQTLRSQTAFVLQDPFLFEATVFENIRYGKLDATDEEVIEAAKKGECA